MRYLILEDEKIASNRLKEMIANLRPDYHCVLTLDSVESAVISLPALKLDLVFMDIQLADGNSFDIFDQIKFDAPIIYTTAYDEYALKAFKSNSVDYLLKPIDPVELAGAIAKFEKHSVKDDKDVTQLMQSLKPEGKERFVVKVGEHLKSVLTKNVQLIYSQDKGTYLFTDDGKRFLVDYTMDRVEEMLSPKEFFRISRKFLVHIDYIKDIVSYTNSRLEIMIDGFTDDQVIVARERVSDFKVWLDR
ncbi:LytR/AlgR family response regulator transcription factor [Marinoscillum pacificum]|uniref:LytR/AlgR family response regulator transcription factor n=1 Tax=Marinoscillum pacificum TaxID=392723 RepID=UPI0021575718|nr:LytTR family DNA-binding domain-containing protein [Marinoscillum pacificum]